MRFAEDNRAISNALGFIIVFAIVVASISVIYTAGYDRVLDLREGEQAENAQRAMFVAQQNLNDLHVRGVPGRGTEMALKGSALSITDSTDVTVTVDDPDTGTTRTYAVNSKVLEYRTNDEFASTLQLGGVVRTTEAGGMMAKDPPMQFGSERTTLSLVEMRGNDSIGGTETVFVVFRRSSTTLLEHNDTSTGSELTVTVEVDTTEKRAQAWGRYFNNEGLTAVDGDPSDGTVAYKINTDEIVLRRSVIEAHFE